MNRWSLYSVCVVLVLCLLTAALPGCINGVKDPVTTTPSIPASYQDRELISIGSDSGKVLQRLISNISDDTARNDLVSLETDSAMLSHTAGEYYFLVKDLRVSGEYQEWKSSYLLALLDLQTAGDYFSKSARLARSGDYENASIYLEQGYTLFQRSNYYLGRAAGPANGN